MVWSLSEQAKEYGYVSTGSAQREEDDGLSIYYKRLEKGVYEAPVLKEGLHPCVQIERLQLQLILQGVEIGSIHKKKRFVFPAHTIGRLGLTLPDSSVHNWIHAAGYYLEPLYERHKALVLNSDYLHADETTIQVLDSNKKGATHQGYYWAYQSHADKLVLFEYQRGRGKEGPREMLQHFKGFLQTDGYQVYEQFGEQEGIVLIHCMAHARRKFSEALGNDKTRADYALGEIQRLYAIERYIQEQGLVDEAKQSYRQTHARPILQSLKKWMEQAIQEVLPKSAIGKALHYALPRWERWSVYAETDLLHIDNNPIENSIRPIAIGRKNYLFAGNDKAAQRAAMFYSLLATCKNYSIHPFEWLTDVLNRINEHKFQNIDELLPQNWKPLI